MATTDFNPATSSWFFSTYRPDPTMTRSFRAIVLLSSGGFLSLMCFAGVAVAQFAEPSGMIALIALTAPPLGVTLGAIIDGYAMLKEKRISWLGRLTVAAVTVVAVIAITGATFVIRPLFSGATSGVEKIPVADKLTVPAKHELSDLPESNPTVA